MIRVFEPKIDLQDIFEVSKTLYNSNISGTSKTVEKFERQLADKFERKYAVALSNGSVALDVALNLIDLNEEDEVILPSFTIVSCLSAVIRSGAKPVFCDVDQLTWNMKLDNVKEVYTEKTKAVLMVHTFGLTAEAKKISDFCSEKNLILIEDAAEAHGQIESSLKCGSFGDISTMSFYANKHITTGEGGAVLTNSKEKYDLAKQIINLDFKPAQRFKHDNLYWNYRMGGLQAALGISQIKKVEKTINKKIEQGLFYNKILKEHEDIVSMQPIEINSIKNNFWVFGLLLQRDSIRDSVIKHLYENNIETRPFFWPLHLQPALPKEYVTTNKNLSISENLGMNGLYIPIGAHLKRKNQIEIVKKLIEAVELFSK